MWLDSSAQLLESGGLLPPLQPSQPLPCSRILGFGKPHTYTTSLYSCQCDTLLTDRCDMLMVSQASSTPTPALFLPNLPPSACLLKQGPRIASISQMLHQMGNSAFVVVVVVLLWTCPGKWLCLLLICTAKGDCFMLMGFCLIIACCFH